MTDASQTKAPSELRIRQFELGRDYPELCEWWRSRGWKALPPETLPAIGLIAEDDTHKFAAIFIYFVESNWAYLEWLVTNPGSPLKKRGAAIDLVIDHALNVMSHAGTQRVHTSLKNKNLIKVFERHGFKVGDTEMTNLTCQLGSGV